MAARDVYRNISFQLETQNQNVISTTKTVLNIKISTTKNVVKAGAFWTSSFAMIDGL